MGGNSTLEEFGVGTLATGQGLLYLFPQRHRERCRLALLPARFGRHQRGIPRRSHQSRDEYR